MLLLTTLVHDRPTCTPDADSYIPQITSKGFITTKELESHAIITSDLTIRKRSELHPASAADDQGNGQLSAQDVSGIVRSTPETLNCLRSTVNQSVRTPRRQNCNQAPRITSPSASRGCRRLTDSEPKTGVGILSTLWRMKIAED